MLGNKMIRLAVGCIMLGTAGLHAQVVQVRGLLGSAGYSMGGGTPASLRGGMAVPVGATVKTGPGSAVDLALGHNAGVVRLLQNSTVTLEKFNAPDPNPAAPVDLQLALGEGTLVGFDQKLSSNSKYRIKVPQGIAQVSGSKYRINSQGYLVLVDGSAVFAFVTSVGSPAPFELRTPPPVYFSPVEGVRPAPPELVREVVLQTKGQLKNR